MNSDTDRKKEGADTRRHLRALAVSADNRRRLQALPLFRTEKETPDRFERLLRRLDNVEASRAG